MGRLNDSGDPGREARARMAQAENASRRKFMPSAERSGAPREPRRYRLYDRIKDRVSVNTMNVIIAATALLLVVALVYGIATGTPR